MKKHLIYHKIKKFTLDLELNNIDEFLDLNKQYAEMCEFIIVIKKKMHNIRFRNSLNIACEHFLNNDPQRAWSELKKLSKPSFSSKALVAIKDKNRKTLISQDDQLNRFAEHYKKLASDATSHSLDENYWKNVLGSSQISAETWDINHPITMLEIESTIKDMKSNKAPGPDEIPTEFFKAFFKNDVPSDDHSNPNTTDNNYFDCDKCLLLLFNKI